MLMVSELAEALEEYRDRPIHETWYAVNFKADEPVPEDVRDVVAKLARQTSMEVTHNGNIGDDNRMTSDDWDRLVNAGIAKPEGVPSELADTVIRILDTAEAYGIDLGFEIERKMRYNETRAFRHGGRLV